MKKYIEIEFPNCRNYYVWEVEREDENTFYVQLKGMSYLFYSKRGAVPGVIGMAKKYIEFSIKRIYLLSPDGKIKVLHEKIFQI